MVLFIGQVGCIQNCQWYRWMGWGKDCTGLKDVKYNVWTLPGFWLKCLKGVMRRHSEDNWGNFDFGSNVRYYSCCSVVQLCLALCDPMVGSPRSGCQHGWVLMRALFLPYRPLPSCPVLTWPFFRESAQGQRRETETQLSEDAFFCQASRHQDPSSPARDWTWALCRVEVQSLNHRTTRKFPSVCF